MCSSDLALAGQIGPHQAQPARDQPPGDLADPAVVEIFKRARIERHGNHLDPRGFWFNDGTMSKLEIEPVLCLKDNYAYLVYDRADGVCGVVDPSEPEPVKRALAARGLSLTHIFNTHHHNDHVGGNLALKEFSGAKVVGPEKDAARIPGIDIGVNEGETFKLGSHGAKVLEIRAHTRQHIAFWLDRKSTRLNSSH